MRRDSLLKDKLETEDDKYVKGIVDGRLEEFKHAFDDEEIKKMDNDLETYIDKNAKGKKKK